MTDPYTWLLGNMDAVIGWGMGGSHLYGLATETSDEDLTYIVDHYRFPHEAQQQLGGGATDLRIIPARRFVEATSGESSPNYVDLLMSREFTWFHSHPLTPYVRLAGYSPIKYMDMLARHTKSMLHQYAEEKKDEKRLNKMLKVALRNTMMSDKMLHEGEAFNPTLTPEEREFFYCAYDNLLTYPRDFDILYNRIHTLNFPLKGNLHEQDD